MSTRPAIPLPGSAATDDQAPAATWSAPDSPSIADPAVLAPRSGDTPAVDTSFLPDGPGADAWGAFLESHALLVRRLAAELEAEEGLSLADFDALMQIALAPAGRRRMSELADAVLLSRSGISRMVDRLVAAGLVERRICPSDARGAEAALTPAGEARLRTAAAVHFRGVASHFVDVLPVDDRVVLTRALRAVADHNRGIGEPDTERCG